MFEQGSACLFCSSIWDLEFTVLPHVSFVEYNICIVVLIVVISIVVMLKL